VLREILSRILEKRTAFHNPRICEFLFSIWRPLSRKQHCWL